MANLRANKITTGTADYQGSIYASGTGAYLFTKTTAPGTDDFTIECWINSNDAGGGSQEGVFAINDDTDGFQSGSGNQIRLVQGRNGGSQTGGLEVDLNGTTVGTANGADLIQEGTWYHVAVTRASGTVKIWIDGVEKASGSAAGDVTGGTFITGYYDSGYTFQGYMSNFRYRKGTAHYTTTFTPPTGALERTTDTELLFAQSVNNAGNGYSSAIHGGTTDIMQVNGNVTANTQAPTLTTTSDVGVVFGAPIKINTQGVMYFPTGDTTQRGRGRGVLGGGQNPGNLGTIDFVTIHSMGNSLDFGDLNQTGQQAGCSSSTRGLFANGSNNNTIDFITIATTGNAVNFGDRTVALNGVGALSSSTRGVFLGGGSPSPQSNVMDYITIAATGNATDFGDLTTANKNPAGCSSPVRGVIAMGGSPNEVNTIDFITIATTGNSQDFGDCLEVGEGRSAFSSSTRGIFTGSFSTPTVINVIQYVTIATTGNAKDFGDLILARTEGAGTSDSIRGLSFGGFTPGSPVTPQNIIDYVTISTTGNAKDFGDLTQARQYPGACSDSHGGLS